MEWQTVINIGLGAILAALGWFAREIWDALKELRRDIHRIEKDLPEVYARRDEFRDAMKEVRLEMNNRFDKLENLISMLYDRLNDKADK
jgi:low affinity Fe/Cu permease